MKFTNGNKSSDGVLEIIYQGEWYTTCQPNDYSSYYYNRYVYNRHANVVCKELGYERGVIASDSRRRVTSEQHQLWYYDLYCEGTEDSIYDCSTRYNDFSYRYCYYVPEYSCQSMNIVPNYIKSN